MILSISVLLLELVILKISKGFILPKIERYHSKCGVTSLSELCLSASSSDFDLGASMNALRAVSNSKGNKRLF